MHHREGRNGRFLHTGLVLALSAGTALAQQNAVNFADMVVGPRGEVDVVKPGPIPLSKELGVNMPGVLPTVTLAGVENQMLLAEDAAVADASMPLRIGVGRAAEVNAGDGVWLQPRGKGQGDGRLWVCDIQSPSATAIRVHLTGMGIPEGGMLRVYSPEHPDAVTEYRGSGQYGDGDQYTFPTEGDTVRLEYFAPPAEEMNEALPFAIDSVQHYYRAMREIAGGYGEREGTCHNDVTCYPAYATSAKAVGKLTFVQGGSSYLCTGQLMATTAGDYTPWLSTANHCISTNAVANTLVVYWLYQTSVCNSGSPGSGPTSSGASLQFTNSTGDFTLLMVDGTLPRTQVSWLGWDAGAVANGTTLAAIHHPGGAYKRISFGTAQANTADHIRCNWTSGVTEGGSSGSVLMVTSTQRFIGDLTGGPSACGAAPANLYDTYGFLNYNYNNDGTGHPLQAALAAGTDDSLEQNDSCAAAIAPASSSYTGLVVKWQDEDWYRFTVANGASLGLTVSYTQANGDVDVEIYDGCGGPVVASGHGTSGTETINYTNTSGASKTYYARVYLVSDTRNTYNLTIGGGPPPAGNDACSGATGVAAGGTYTGTTADATNDGQTSCGTSNTSKDRWFTYTATANGTLSLDTCGSGYDTVLSVHSGCPGTSANSVACNDDAASGGPCTGNASALSMAVTSGTTYKIRVSGYNGASGAFTLHVGFTGSAPDNNACASATAVSSGGTYTGTTATATNDGSAACGSSTTAKDRWYTFTAPQNATLKLDTCGSGYDTVLSVHTACPGTSANSVACNDDGGTGAPCTGTASYVSMAATSGATYKIRVSGYNGASGTYTLHVTFIPGAGAEVGNDLCNTAQEVFDGPTPFANGNAGTDGPDEPGACDAFGYTQVDNDVWFRYAAVCDGPVTASTCGSDFDTKMMVYAACPEGSGGAIACNDDAPAGVCAEGTLQSQLTFEAAAGNGYIIRVGGFRGARGSGTLNISHSCDGGTPCPADFNEDGGVDGADVISFFGAWERGDSNADTNQDGGVDGDDVAVFFLAWQAGGC